MSLTFIDFFAGIGGFRRGMERAGHKCVGFCEFDKFAVASYTSMHLITDEQREHLTTLPLNKRQKEILKEKYRNGEWYANDIRTINARSIPKADVWCFGFPCQDISVAGKQLGFNGSRSSLFFAVMRLIQQLEEEDRPKYLFVENVKNLLSVNGGFDFAKFLVELDEGGYDAEWQVINSSDYVPQNRERIFVIGHLRGRNTNKVFPIEGADRKNNISIVGHRDGYRRNLQTYDPDGITEALDTAGGGGREFHVIVPENKINTIGAIRAKKENYGQDRERIIFANGISPTLRSTDFKEPIRIGVPVLTPERPEKRQNGRKSKENGDDSFTLTRADKQGVMVKAPDEEGVDKVWNEKYKCYIAIRKVTTKECFRLQGWMENGKDEYFERAQFVNSDSQLYKQAGNGVTVDVIADIASKME